MSLIVGILNAIGRKRNSGGSGFVPDDDNYLTTESSRPILTEGGDYLLWEAATILLSEDGFGLLTENYNQLTCEQYE